MSDYEKGNPDYKGYPGEPIEDIEVLNWWAYLDADLNWIEITEKEMETYNDRRTDTKA